MKTDDSALGAAITRSLANGSPAGDCPSLEKIAELVDGSPGGAERDLLLGHLALCDRCRELFVAASELASDEQDTAKQPTDMRRNYVVPSAFAAAAVLIIALTLQMRPLPTDKGMVAEHAAPAAPRVATSGKPTPNRSDANMKDETPVAAENKAVVAGAGPATGSERPARLLLRYGDPEQLAALAAAQEKGFGFAMKGDARTLAFRTGVNLMNLEVSLLAKDRDRAEAVAARLAPLLEALAGNPDAPPLERMVASLEQGTAPESLAGTSAELELMLPREQLPYTRLGAWAQGAKLAAKSGNRDYLAAGVPHYFGKKLSDPSLPPQAEAALRELDRKLKKARSMHLELVEKDVAALLEAF